MIHITVFKRGNPNVKVIDYETTDPGFSMMIPLGDFVVVLQRWAHADETAPLPE